MGCRVWIGITAVPISTREVARPMSAAAVSASNSSGICGTQIDVKPAASAASAPATSLSTFSRYRPRSGPIMRPIRTALPSRRGLLLRQLHSRFSRVSLAYARPARPYSPAHAAEDTSMGRVAVVTGAAPGMAHAIAQRLASSGHRVAVLDLDGEAAERTPDQLRGNGAQALGIGADVSDRRAVDDALTPVRQELPPLAIA